MKKALEKKDPVIINENFQMLTKSCVSYHAKEKVLFFTVKTPTRKTIRAGSNRSTHKTAQLMDAIAVGHFTPGSVFSFVTFIGFQINGLLGAIVSTIAIFLPSFVFVALLNPLMTKLRNSKWLSTFLDAVNVASVAIIAAVCYEMGKETITDWRTIFIAVISTIIVFNFKKINSAFVVLGGSFLGYILLAI